MLKERRELNRTVKIIITVSTVLCLISLAFRFGLPNFLPWGQYSDLYTVDVKAASTFLNRNSMAGYVEMAIPIAVSVLLLKRPSFKFMIGVSFILLVTLFLTLSRGGWISTSVSICFMAAFIMSINKVLTKKNIMIFFSIFVFTGLIALSNTKAVERVVLLYNEEGLGRLQYWQGTIDMIHANWLTGVGPGGFAISFPAFQLPNRGRVYLANNDYLQFISETGIFLIPIVLYLVFSLFSHGSRKIKSADRKIAYINIGAMAGILAMLVHSFVDFNLHFPAHALLFVILCALVAGPIPEHCERR